MLQWRRATVDVRFDGRDCLAQCYHALILRLGLHVDIGNPSGQRPRVTQLASVTALYVSAWHATQSSQSTEQHQRLLERMSRFGRVRALSDGSQPAFAIPRVLAVREFLKALETQLAADPLTRADKVYWDVRPPSVWIQINDAGTANWPRVHHRALRSGAFMDVAGHALDRRAAGGHRCDGNSAPHQPAADPTCPGRRAAGQGRIAAAAIHRQPHGNRDHGAKFQPDDGEPAKHGA
jgi:hypothetical protein